MRTVLIAVLVLLISGVAAPAQKLLDQGEKLEAPVYGGFLGYVCAETHSCDYPDSARCGAGDYFGICRPRPEYCTKEYLPVCGCDGQNHSNSCQAAKREPTSLYPGKCR